MPSNNRQPSQNPMEANASQPLPKVEINTQRLYGVLHDRQGKPIQSQVRSLKIGFGQPEGKDIHVYISANPQHKDKPWRISVGKYDGSGKRVGSEVTMYANKEEAKAAYLELRSKAPERKFPMKFPYFTFSRMGQDGSYWPDFEAIEIHGAQPSSITIVCLKEDPLEASYQAWTGVGLQCTGDGRNARRRVTWAQGEAEKKIAAQAMLQGEEWFGLPNGCATFGCPYVKGDKPACKTHGRLYVQLAAAPRLGSSASYDTTGKRSIRQLFTSLNEIREGLSSMGGQLAGVPLQLRMAPYKTSHNGKSSMQFAVSLEFVGTNAVEMITSLRGHATAYASAAHRPMAALPPGPEKPAEAQDEAPATVVEEAVFVSEQEEAAAMAAEFYSTADEDLILEGDDDEPEETSNIDQKYEAAIAGGTEIASAPTPAEPAATKRTPGDGGLLAQLAKWPEKRTVLFDLFKVNGHGKTEAQFTALVGRWNGPLDELEVILRSKA